MLHFRLNAAPSIPMPVNVRSAGHYHLAANQQGTRAPGDFLQVFWSVSGGGSCAVGRRTHAIKPGVVFFYEPGEPHDLRAGPAGWEYRWLTLDGPHREGITEHYGISRVQVAGACPLATFDQLDACLQDPTLNGELRASVLGYEILLLASAAPSDVPTEGIHQNTAPQAKALLDLRFTEARLNVNTLAAKLRVHRATLHRVFKKTYGVSPVQYLGRLRIRLALELLTGTRLPIADVAVRAGLPDLAYFSKLISHHTGYSPRAYRERHTSTAQEDAVR